jgi:hypothetical protein
MLTLRRRNSTCQVLETNFRSQASSMPKPCPNMRRPTINTRGLAFVSASKQIKKEDPFPFWNEIRHLMQVLKTPLRWHSRRNLLGCAGEAACWWQRGLCIAIWGISSTEGNSPALQIFKIMQSLQYLPRAYHLTIAWSNWKLIRWCPPVLLSLKLTRLLLGKPWIRP